MLSPRTRPGQRGLFLCESLDDVERHLHASLVQSTVQEAIPESYHEGKEVNGLLRVAGRRAVGRDAV